MQRRGRTLPILAASALLVVSAASVASAQDDVTTIVFTGDGSETFMAAQMKVIELFEAAHPNIKVKFEPAPGVDAEQGAILRLGQGDTSLDVVTTEVGYEYQWFKNG